MLCTPVGHQQGLQVGPTQPNVCVLTSVALLCACLQLRNATKGRCRSGNRACQQQMQQQRQQVLQQAVQLTPQQQQQHQQELRTSSQKQHMPCCRLGLWPPPYNACVCCTPPHWRASWWMCCWHQVGPVGGGRGERSGWERSNRGTQGSRGCRRARGGVLVWVKGGASAISSHSLGLCGCKLLMVLHPTQPNPTQPLPLPWSCW